MSKFQEVLTTEVDDIQLLPLLHTCDAYSLRRILESMRLKPQLCDVFKLDLLYTYYGVPSYRSKYDKATKNTAYYPICIILDSSQFNNFHKIFPFDSGAFVKLPEVKDTFFHHQTAIEDFELERNISSAMKVIKTFYESNENYIYEKPNSSKEFSLLDFEALSYKNLISNENNGKLDDRASSIEIIFDEDIVLNTSTVKQIIIPNVFKDDSKVCSLLENNFGVKEALGYSTFKGMPREYFGQIRQLYLQFLNL